LALLLFALGLAGNSSFGQTPALLWTTNVNARVIGADSQTNVYADAGGTVIQLDGAGQIVQSFFLSSYTGLAQRGADGSFQYAGVYPPFINPNDPQRLSQYSAPACVLTKYDQFGSPIWSVDFGPVGVFREPPKIRDVQLDSDGNIYVSFTYFSTTMDHVEQAAKFDPNGFNFWTVDVPKVGYMTTIGYVHFGPISPTNGYVLSSVSQQPCYMKLSRFDSDGGMTTITNWLDNGIAAGQLMRPIANSAAESYYFHDTVLIKQDANAQVLQATDTGIQGQWTVGPDQFGGVHAANDASVVQRFDYNENLVWTLSLPSRCNAMVLDPSGNRFISMLSGEVGRIGSEAISSPTITNAPHDLTVFTGSNVLMSVSATGSAPLRYFWKRNGTVLAAGSSSDFSIPNAGVADAGSYSVIVSNFAGSATSSPAVLRVKQVALYLGGQLLTSGNYNFATPPVLSIRSAFPSGSAFYTLDGSTPNFTSTYYSGPFTLSNSAVVRAIGYTSDFSQTEEADSINATVIPQHTLSASTPGGGAITLNPPGGTYSATNIVTATAVPASGWTFLYWTGDASGSAPVIHVTMESDKTIQAVFGTTLSTTVSGNGQIQVVPQTAFYPFGSIVRLTGIPQPGNYFGFWGNAASGNTNPLYFSITTSNPTISSIFAATPPDQAALTVLINGPGSVTPNPRANVYPTNQTVTLTATPYAGQGFTSWSGDVAGTQNPISIPMHQSKVVTANFTNWPVLIADHQSMTPTGFRITVISGAQLSYQIFGSTNLVSWQSLGTVTNTSGQTQFIDSGATNLPKRFYRAGPWP
jgi:hypothetical protein